MAGVNSILAEMRKAGKIKDNKAKGNLGEDAVLALCADRKNKLGNGLLYQSYKYPYQTNASGVCYTGNIKLEGDKYVEFTRESLEDEIDVLYITPYRIFILEVKSYHARYLQVYDYWFNKDNTPVDKSPIMQAEKHARHLYHAIHDVIPDGNPKYIIPMCVFVDRCKVQDDRPKELIDYAPVCILNNLLAKINEYNTPLEYNLDLEQIRRKLKEVQTSIKREL